MAEVRERAEAAAGAAEAEGDIAVGAVEADAAGTGVLDLERGVFGGRELEGSEAAATGLLGDGPAADVDGDAFSARGCLPTTAAKGMDEDVEVLFEDDVDVEDLLRGRLRCAEGTRSMSIPAAVKRVRSRSVGWGSSRLSWDDYAKIRLTSYLN